MFSIWRQSVALLCFTVIGVAPCIAASKSNPTDIVPPKFKPHFTNSTVKNDKINIMAKVTDNLGVAGVTLFYRVKGTHRYRSVEMKSVGSHLYEIHLPAARFQSAVEYYIVARDVGDNHAFRGGPDKPLQVDIGKPQPAMTTAAQTNQNTTPKQQPSLAKSLEKKDEPNSGTSRWVWIAIGSLVAGGVAAAVDSQNDGGGGGTSPRSDGITVTVSGPAP